MIRRLPQSTPAVAALPVATVNASDARSVAHVLNGANKSSPAPVRHMPAVVAPLAIDRYKVRFTIGRETHNKLRRVQDLLRHVVPNGNPALIFDRALTLLVEDLERRKLSKVKRISARCSFAKSRLIGLEVVQNSVRRDSEC